MALQEVDKNLSRSNFDDQSNISAEALGMHYHHCVNQYFADVSKEKGDRNPATFSWGPVRFRLDYIYISDQLQSLDAYAVKNPLTRIASDRLPMVAVKTPKDMRHST